MTPELPSPVHDSAILVAARAAADRIRLRRRRRTLWSVPLAATLGLVVGVGVGRSLIPVAPSSSTRLVATPTPLVVPIRGVTRGESAQATGTPVEHVSADDWYRYIQELFWAGQLEEAELHLRRFVELHPGYRPPPR